MKDDVITINGERYVRLTDSLQRAVQSLLDWGDAMGEFWEYAADEEYATDRTMELIEIDRCLLGGFNLHRARRDYETEMSDQQRWEDRHK